MPTRIVRRMALLPALLLLFGCGDDRLATVPVRGVVTCGGKPVTTGSLSFNPVVDGSEAATAARPAMGAIQADGTFVLSTYVENDGAVVGKHVVWYQPPALPGEEVEAEEEEEDGATSPPPLPPDPKAPCKFGGRAEVEVVDGENDLQIELNPLDRSGEEGGEENAF